MDDRPLYFTVIVTTPDSASTGVPLFQVLPDTNWVGTNAWTASVVPRTR